MILFGVAKAFGTPRIIWMINREAQRWNKEATGFLGCNTMFSKQYLEEIFSSPVPIMFEGHSVMAPIGMHDLLKIYYGDYKTPPPIEKQYAPHDFQVFWI